MEVPFVPDTCPALTPVPSLTPVPPREAAGLAGLHALFEQIPGEPASLVRWVDLIAGQLGVPAGEITPWNDAGRGPEPQRCRVLGGGVGPAVEQAVSLPVVLRPEASRDAEATRDYLNAQQAGLGQVFLD